MMKIPVLLFSIKTVERMGRRLRPVGRALLPIQPKLREVLPKIGLELEPEAYVVGSLISALIYGLLFFAVALVAVSLRAETETGPDPTRIAATIGFGVWIVFFLLHLIYPGIILKKIATLETRDLLFALREIIMNVDSGVPLFDSMKNVAGGEYRQVSKDFESVIKNIEAGTSEVEALKNLALNTESEHMKRVIWQIVNAMESGASMKAALSGLVEAMETATYQEIKNYSSNLNFLLLIYMLIAAVLPSLGITFMVLLSAFGGLGVDLMTVTMLIISSAVMQIMMIGYMSTTRPELFGG